MRIAICREIRILCAIFWAKILICAICYAFSISDELLTILAQQGVLVSDRQPDPKIGPPGPIKIIKSVDLFVFISCLLCKLSLFKEMGSESYLC